MFRKPGPLDRVVELQMDAVSHLRRAVALAAEEAAEYEAAARKIVAANRIADPLALERSA